MIGSSGHLGHVPSSIFVYTPLLYPTIGLSGGNWECSTLFELTNHMQAREPIPYLELKKCLVKLVGLGGEKSVTKWWCQSAVNSLDFTGNEKTDAHWLCHLAVQSLRLTVYPVEGRR